MVEAVAVGGDELDVKRVGRDVDVAEAEVLIVDEAASLRLHLVEGSAAGAGDDEAGRVAFDM